MALDHLQSTTEPIIHRDVKPSNLMLCGADHQHVKLIDFGLARQLPCNITDLDGDCDIKQDDFGETRRMMTGNTGTYRYMAPEVWHQQVCTSFHLKHLDRHLVLSRRTCKSTRTHINTDTMRTHAPALTHTHIHAHARITYPVLHTEVRVPSRCVFRDNGSVLFDHRQAALCEDSSRAHYRGLALCLCLRRAG